MVEHAARSLEEDEGKKVSCVAGCTHCCHLLIEISWEEAEELANWLVALPAAHRSRVVARVQESAESARELFSRRSKTQKFMAPSRKDTEIPDDVFDQYFYEKKRPCPFLELGRCAAYEVRPTPCRLHMVTSSPELCAADTENDEAYDIPDAFEELKEDAAPVISAVERDGRWGQLAIMVEAVLKEMGILGTDSAPDPTQARGAAVAAKLAS